MGPSVWQILIVLLVVLLFFGAPKLPEIGAGLGRAIRNFRRGYSDPEEIDISKNNQAQNAQSTANAQGAAQNASSAAPKSDAQ